MNKHRYPGSYDDVIKTLPRMEKAGEVKRHNKDSRYKPTLWSRPHVKPEAPENEKHEEECGWIFVPFWLNENVSYWDWSWTPEEVKKYGIYRGKSFRFDRRMKYKDVWVFFEHDRGSRTEVKLREQIENYVRFGEKWRGKFHVVYSLTFARNNRVFAPEYVKEKIADRASFLLEEFERIGHGKQFSVARYQDISWSKDKELHEQPNVCGPNFVTPLDPMKKLTLDELVS